MTYLAAAAAGAALAVFARHAATQIRIARQEKRNRRAWDMYRPKIGDQ